MAPHGVAHSACVHPMQALRVLLADCQGVLVGGRGSVGDDLRCLVNAPVQLYDRIIETPCHVSGRTAT